MMESTDSSSNNHHHPQLPPGFRFHPTDEELVVHYLKRKASSSPLPVTIIADIDLYKFDPWELPSKATFGEQEWYFFSPRERKYPNGARPNRAATSGYWKATGTDKPIMTCNGTQKVGVKKALVFYGGKPPKGIKTNWIMHEYRLFDNNSNPNKPPGSDTANKKTSSKLDDWVLCRIYKKNNTQRPMMERDIEEAMEAKPPTPTLMPTSLPNHIMSKPPLTKPSNNYTSLLDDNFFEGILSGDHHHLLHQSLQNPNSIAQLASNSSSKITSLPMKRSIQSFNSPNKRFNGHGLNSYNTATGTSDQENSSFVSLFSQLPESTNTTSFHPNSLLGSIADHGDLRQQFQLPSMNWNS